MDQALREAAAKGDVNYLRNEVSLQDAGYLLTQFYTETTKEDCARGNIFHLAIWADKPDFFREAMEMLPEEHTKQLLSQEDQKGFTPLHTAVDLNGTNNNSYEIVKLIIDFGKSLSSKLWLAVTWDNCTALHLALRDDKVNENCAMEILQADVELLSCMVDDYGNSPLFLALRYGYTQVAETILMSFPSLSSICVSGPRGSTPLHFAPYCSEKVLRLMLEKCEDCINKVDEQGYTVLHQWAKIGETWPCELLLKTSEFRQVRDIFFRRLLFRKENAKGDHTPLHMAAREKDSEIGQVMVRGYQQLVREIDEGKTEEQELVASVEIPPWRTENNTGNIALHVALYPNSRHQLALDLLSIDSTMSQIRNDKGESPLFLAVLSASEQAVDEILKIQEPSFDMLCRTDGTTMLHYLHLWPGTITFAAGFTLPGGINGNTGEAILAKKVSFLVFLLADVYAMCTSMLVLFCLIWSMVSEPDMARILLDRSVFILMQSLYGTLLAFMTGIYTVIANTSLWPAILVFLLCSVIGISVNRTFLHNVIAKLVPAANYRDKKDDLQLAEEGNAAAYTTGTDISSKTE